MSTFPSCLPCQPGDPRLFALPQTLLLLHEGAQAYGGQTQIIVILVWKNFDVKCQINNVISNGCGTNWKIMDPILRRKTMPPWRSWTRSCARVSHSIYGSMGLNWCPASDKYILEGRDEVSICVCQLSIPVFQPARWERSGCYWQTEMPNPNPIPLKGQQWYIHPSQNFLAMNWDKIDAKCFVSTTKLNRPWSNPGEWDYVGTLVASECCHLPATFPEHFIQLGDENQSDV